MLRDARWRMITGGQTVAVEYGSNETRRRVQYQPADLSRLEEEIARAEAECAQVSGVVQSRRRYALSGAYRPFIDPYNSGGPFGPRR